MQLTSTKQKWIETPRNLGLPVPYIKSIPIRPLGDNQIQYEIRFEGKVYNLVVHHQKALQTSGDKLYDDMCQMTTLNQPQVLNNLVKRYQKNIIFTYIGPTLIVINPYQLFKNLFNKETMLSVRDAVLSNNFQKQPPHIYMIAGKAYQSMINNQTKQAIVISGQSGAGKTQSTKYCMQLLTSLSHKQAHQIEGKILACNPLLQAFGNSKTIRNDNSSRFGKYVRIMFGNDNTIQGATINSYLLEKSRVVSVSPNERSFHIFYSITAAKIENLEQASKYLYLSQSNCYIADNHNDLQYFDDVNKSMDQIGFPKEDKNKIWKLLASILNLGNIQFNDHQHKNNQSKPCQIKDKTILTKISQKIGIANEHLQKILLFQKKKFLKEFTQSPYSKNGCISNRNTLSKAIYNACFQYILFMITQSLSPKNNNKFNSISILDIFGFQNFIENTFEQLCINFTNEKLLKLYNKYIFEREMEILKQDGLSKQIQSIKPPTNDNIIQLMSGNLSIFSIINDLTMPQQYKDQDMIAGFKNKIIDPKHKQHLQFDLHNTKKFLIKHSQCDVMYSITNFKSKNQDKVNLEIQNIVTNLFTNQNKDNVGKTLLSKFYTDINDLMSELVTSNVHFVRCIKPNQTKKPNSPQQHYMLSQVRYLGVFETIQIRKKTFPYRKSYSEFVKIYKIIFPKIIDSNEKRHSLKIIQQITTNTKNYMLGEKRIYITDQLQNQLNKKLYILLKVQNQKAKVIQRMFRKLLIRRTILKKLHLLAKRIRIWKKIAQKKALQIQRIGIEKIKIYSNEIKRKIIEQQKLKIKQKKQKQQLERLNKLIQKNPKKGKVIQSIPLLVKAIQKLTINKLAKIEGFSNLKEYYVNIKDESIVQNQNINYKNIKKIKQYQSEKKQSQQYKMSQSFLQQNSISIISQSDSLFKKTLTVDFFNPNETPNIEKLRLIINQKYKVDIGENEEDYFSPSSEDCKFRLEQTDKQIYNKIISFSTVQFFKDVLRKRTNFIGIRRSEEDILRAKPRPLLKSLTHLDEEDEQEALRIFKILVKIGDQAKVQNVFKLIENMIELCKGSSIQLRNQVFLMLIKQSNTTSQLISIRIYQSLSLFLHIYCPQPDFIYAGLNMFFTKIAQKSLTEKQQQYARYLFKKMLRLIQKPFNINYMPTKYQMMALMCKRKISVPIYLPVGNSILLRVQSYSSFTDIKIQVMQQFGINHKRLNPNYFTFFEIVNFQHQDLGESPINQNQNVWDVMTYWQKAKQKYKESQIVPPAFFLMLKVRYAYQCMKEDQQTIQIFFVQCFFDYFIGRIKLDIDKMALLSACIKKLKLSNKPNDGIIGAYPTWVIKNYDNNILAQKMKNYLNLPEFNNLTELEIKYKFLQICQGSPLALALAIPTQQPIKLFMKPKMIYLAEKCNVLQSFSIRNIVKWAVDKQKFVFETRGDKNQGKNKTHAIFTEHASICSSYLSLVTKLIQSSKNSNNKILPDM